MRKYTKVARKSFKKKKYGKPWRFRTKKSTFYKGVSKIAKTVFEKRAEHKFLINPAAGTALPAITLTNNQV